MKIPQQSLIWCRAAPNCWWAMVGWNLTLQRHWPLDLGWWTSSFLQPIWRSSPWMHLWICLYLWAGCKRHLLNRVLVEGFASHMLKGWKGALFYRQQAARVPFWIIVLMLLRFCCTINYVSGHPELCRGFFLLFKLEKKKPHILLISQESVTALSKCQT